MTQLSKRETAHACRALGVALVNELECEAQLGEGRGIRLLLSHRVAHIYARALREAAEALDPDEDASVLYAAGEMLEIATR